MLMGQSAKDVGNRHYVGKTLQVLHREVLKLPLPKTVVGV